MDFPIHAVAFARADVRSAIAIPIMLGTAAGANVPTPPRCRGQDVPTLTASLGRIVLRILGGRGPIVAGLVGDVAYHLAVRPLAQPLVLLATLVGGIGNITHIAYANVGHTFGLAELDRLAACLM